MEQGLRICCYTAITGGYDSIHDPAFVTSGVDYICFTDNSDAQSGVWKFKPVPEELKYLSKVKQQRVIKICPHRYLGDYDISIWVDGNIVVRGDLRKFISEYDLGKTPLYTRVHPSRKCVYDEAKAIVSIGKDSESVISPIVERYEREGYPCGAGMAETNILLRRHGNRKCRLFDEAWAIELLLNSHRDQMSFNYVAWKQGFLPGYLFNQVKINNNEYFKKLKHG